MHILSYANSIGESKQITLIMQLVKLPEEWEVTALTPEMTYCFSSVYIRQFVFIAHSSICWSLNYSMFVLFPFLSPLFLTFFRLLSFILLSAIHTCVLTAVMSMGGYVCLLYWESNACLQITEITAHLNWSCPPLIAPSQLLEVLTVSHKQITGDLLWIS